MFAIDRSQSAQKQARQLYDDYELLQRMSRNPMVALNHILAVAMVHGSGRRATIEET